MNLIKFKFSLLETSGGSDKVIGTPHNNTNVASSTSAQNSVKITATQSPSSPVRPPEQSPERANLGSSDYDKDSPSLNPKRMSNEQSPNEKSDSGDKLST